MGAREIRPFWANGSGWSLDETNPFVLAYLENDARDAEALGHVGDITGPAADYFQIWQIIEKTGASISEIEKNWTLERIEAFTGYLDMKAAYKNAWSEFYQQKAQREKEA